VNADISGNIASQFSKYTTEANRQLVMVSFQLTVYQTHTGQRAGGNCQASGEELVPPSHWKLGKG
jgi:hypothetical protein